MERKRIRTVCAAVGMAAAVLCITAIPCMAEEEKIKDLPETGQTAQEEAVTAPAEEGTQEDEQGIMRLNITTGEMSLMYDAGLPAEAVFSAVVEMDIEDGVKTVYDGIAYTDESGSLKNMQLDYGIINFEIAKGRYSGQISLKAVEDEPETVIPLKIAVVESHSGEMGISFSSTVYVNAVTGDISMKYSCDELASHDTVIQLFVDKLADDETPDTSTGYAESPDSTVGTSFSEGYPDNIGLTSDSTGVSYGSNINSSPGVSYGINTSTSQGLPYDSNEESIPQQAADTTAVTDSSKEDGEDSLNLLIAQTERISPGETITHMQYDKDLFADSIIPKDGVYEGRMKLSFLEIEENSEKNSEIAEGEIALDTDIKVIICIYTPKEATEKESVPED